MKLFGPMDKLVLSDALGLPCII